MDRKKRIRRLRRLINQIDPTVNKVLRAHFLIESAIDAILDDLAESPNYLGKIWFNQKVKLVRAFAPRGDANEWSLILALTDLRNEVAHNFQGPNRVKALERFRTDFEKFMRSNDPNYVDPGYTIDQLIVHCTKQSRAFLNSLLGEIRGP